VKIRRKSRAPMYKSRPLEYFVFKDEAITGTMLSMVCTTSLNKFPKSEQVRTYILDDSEAVGIVPMENIGSHEREDGHYIMKDRIRGESS
jgi:hypothetical protein